jgi:hypothetical protein
LPQVRVRKPATSEILRPVFDGDPIKRSAEGSVSAAHKQNIIVAAGGRPDRLTRLASDLLRIIERTAPDGSGVKRVRIGLRVVPDHLLVERWVLWRRLALATLHTTHRRRLLGLYRYS